MERTEKIILTVVAVILVVVVAVFAVNRIGSKIEPEFTPPPFEASAQKGMPKDTGEHYDFVEFPAGDSVCKVYMDANPQLEGDKLKVLLTSDEGNKPLIRVILLDGEMNTVGESGILRPGEYVDAIKLSGTFASGDEIKAKLLTYETDTYYSLGSVSMTLVVR